MGTPVGLDALTKKYMDGLIADFKPETFAMPRVRYYYPDLDFRIIKSVDDSLRNNLGVPFYNFFKSRVDKDLKFKKLFDEYEYVFHLISENTNSFKLCNELENICSRIRTLLLKEDIPDESYGVRGMSANSNYYDEANFDGDVSAFSSCVPIFKHEDRESRINYAGVSDEFRRIGISLGKADFNRTRMAIQIPINSFCDHKGFSLSQKEPIKADKEHRKVISDYFLKKYVTSGLSKKNADDIEACILYSENAIYINKVDDLWVSVSFSFEDSSYIESVINKERSSLGGYQKIHERARW